MNDYQEKAIKYGKETAKQLFRHLKMVPIISYPYLYMVVMIVLIVMGVVEANVNQELAITFMSGGISIAIGVVVTVFAFIMAVFNSIRSACNSYGYRYPARMNFIIKCCQIPAYVINFCIGCLGVLMSVWGLPIIFLMIFIDFLTIVITGTNAIGTCVNLCRNGLISRGKCLLFIVCSYIYVVDVIVAIYLYYKVVKKVAEETT